MSYNHHPPVADYFAATSSMRRPREEEGGIQHGFDHQHQHHDHPSNKRPRYDDNYCKIAPSSSPPHSSSSISRPVYHDNACCLYVSGLNKEDTAESLVRFLQETIHKEYGGGYNVPKIVDCVWMGPAHRPFAKVALADSTQVHSAIQILREKIFSGARLIVNQWGKPHSRDQVDSGSPWSYYRPVGGSPSSHKRPNIPAGNQKSDCGPQDPVQHRPTDDPSCMLFMINISTEATIGNVTTLIEQKCPCRVVRCELMQLHNKKFRRNAQVVLSTPSQAETVLKILDGINFMGNILHVHFWKDRKVNKTKFFVIKMLRHILPLGLSGHFINCHVFERGAGSQLHYTACVQLPNKDLVQSVISLQHKLPFTVAPWSDRHFTLTQDKITDAHDGSIKQAIMKQGACNVKDEECAIFIRGIPTVRSNLETQSPTEKRDSLASKVEESLNATASLRLELEQAKASLREERESGILLSAEVAALTSKHEEERAKEKDKYQIELANAKVKLSEKSRSESEQDKNKIATIARMLAKANEKNQISSDLRAKQKSMAESEKKRYEAALQAERDVFVEKHKAHTQKQIERIEEKAKKQLAYCKSKHVTEKAELEQKLDTVNKQVAALSASLVKNHKTTTKANSWKEERKKLKDDYEKLSTAHVQLRSSSAKEKATLIINEKELKQQLEQALAEKARMDALCVIHRKEINICVNETNGLRSENRLLKQQIEAAVQEKDEFVGKLEIAKQASTSTNDGSQVSPLHAKIEQLDRELMKVKCLSYDQGISHNEEKEKLQASLEEAKKKLEKAEETIHSLLQGSCGKHQEISLRHVSSSTMDSKIKVGSPVRSGGSLSDELECGECEI